MKWFSIISMKIGAFMAFLALFGFLTGGTAAWAGSSSYDLPAAIDPSAKYLIFVHNYYVEKNGPDGACKYYDLLEAFQDRGFTVLSEVRSGKIIPAEYAKKIAAQVNRLQNAGVPDKNITVAGHSKGGVITLNAAALVKNTGVNYVIMAGCGIKSITRFYPEFKLLKGRFLSIYANTDTIAGSCEPVFSKALQGVSSSETKLESDAGHKVFFQPDKIWMNPMFDWLKQ